MEYVFCDLCGANETELVYTVSGMNIVKCLKCGLVYTNPRLDKEERKNNYSEDYFQSVLPNQEIAYDDAKVRLREIRGLKTSGKILEIGCATGEFLDLARKYGWETYGIEISDWASDYARVKLGLNVVTGELENASFPDNFFDVIVMYHVLEHTSSPNELIQKVVHLLKPGGLLVIAVPDITSSNAKRVKESWIALMPKTHLYHFSQDTLTRLLTECNIKVIKVIKEGGTGFLKENTEDTQNNTKYLLLKYIKHLNWIRIFIHWLTVKILRRWDFITVYAYK